MSKAGVKVRFYRIKNRLKEKAAGLGTDANAEIDFDDDVISDVYRKEKIKALLKNNIFGKKEIDKYVVQLLGNNQSIEAKNVNIDSEEDYVKLILIFLYSKSVNMHYDVILTSERCKNNFITFQNFIIKGKSNE